MEFQDIISISGKPGLFLVQKQRNDGLILSRLDGTEKRFYASRSNLFSPLENISIYTLEDSILLKELFEKLDAKYNKELSIEASASASDLRAFMAECLPEYDKERVHVSDIKKVIKWYKELCHYNVDFEAKKEDKDSYLYSCYP